MGSLERPSVVKKTAERKAKRDAEVLAIVDEAGTFPDTPVHPKKPRRPDSVENISASAAAEAPATKKKERKHAKRQKVQEHPQKCRAGAINRC